MTLTAGLAIVAGLVLLAVVVHGAWVAHRAAPRRAKRGQAPASPARTEPSLNPAEGEAQPAHFDLELREVDEPGMLFSTSGPRRGLRIDGLIDAIANIVPDSPVTGEAALQHAPTTRRSGSKPFAIEGLNLLTGAWEMPQAGERYAEFQAGVQLTNRHGPINSIEYSEFIQKVQAFADGLGAAVDFPDMVVAVARGRELDQFAMAHDVKLTVCLKANRVAWSLGLVEQCALKHGLVVAPVAGRFYLPAQEAGAPPLLELSFDAQVALADAPALASLRSLTLSLDVAQTPAQAEPFAEWVNRAQKLSDDLDATPMDDEGRAITPRAFQLIHQQLGMLYEALEARGLPAGSVAARRLFS